MIFGRSPPSRRRRSLISSQSGHHVGETRVSRRGVDSPGRLLVVVMLHRVGRILARVMGQRVWRFGPSIVEFEKTMYADHLSTASLRSRIKDECGSDRGMRHAVEIDRDEWRRVVDIAAIVMRDERDPSGVLRLTMENGVRRWTATDTIRGLCFEVPGGDGSVDVGVSISLVRFFDAAAADGDVATITLGPDQNGDEVVGIEGPGGRMEVYNLRHRHLDVKDTIIERSRAAAVFTIRTSVLRTTMIAANEPQVWDEAQRRPEDPIEIMVSEGNLTIRRPMPVVGDSHWMLDVADCVGAAFARCNGKYLQSLVERFELASDLEIRIPPNDELPIVLTNGDLVAVLAPERSAMSAMVLEVEKVIKEVCGHLAVVRDDDGDYPLDRRDVPIFARFVNDDDASLFQVFAVALHDIEVTSELLKELNDLNTSTSFARMFHTAGQVLVEVDLLAESLDAEELRTALRRIRTMAKNIVPMLSAVFGGNVSEDPAAQRLAFYRTTIIETETTPGVWLALNGPDAVETWPFRGPAFVITGWNPQGVALSDAEHQHINRRIANDIVDRGGRFLHGHGRSPDGEHAEPSLIAWDITRDDAIDMGRKASQDAVFEVNEHEVVLMSCVDNYVESWGRRQ